MAEAQAEMLPAETEEASVGNSAFSDRARSARMAGLAVGFIRKRVVASSRKPTSGGGDANQLV